MFKIKKFNKYIKNNKKSLKKRRIFKKNNEIVKKYKFSIMHIFFLIPLSTVG